MPSFCAADLCCRADRLAVNPTDRLSDNLLADSCGHLVLENLVDNLAHNLADELSQAPSAQPSVARGQVPPGSAPASALFKVAICRRRLGAVEDVCDCVLHLSAALSLQRENKKMSLESATG